MASPLPNTIYAAIPIPLTITGWVDLILQNGGLAVG